MKDVSDQELLKLISEFLRHKGAKVEAGALQSLPAALDAFTKAPRREGEASAEAQIRHFMNKTLASVEALCDEQPLNHFDKIIKRVDEAMDALAKEA